MTTDRHRPFEVIRSGALAILVVEALVLG